MFEGFYVGIYIYEFDTRYECVARVMLCAGYCCRACIDFQYFFVGVLHVTDKPSNRRVFLLLKGWLHPRLHQRDRSGLVEWAYCLYRFDGEES